jgi:sarcosine oxidase
VTNDVDVIVIGGGVMGTAAARSLAERGRQTVLLERSSIGHDRGSSGGPTRIFRLAYADQFYVDMARRALERWRELEARAGDRLLVTTGGVDAGEASRACADAMRAAGVACEEIDTAEAAERWPAIRFDPGTPLFVHEEAAVCLVKQTLAAQSRLAREAGATIVEGVEARTVLRLAGGVEVATDGETFVGRTAVLAAGAWNPPLLAQVGVTPPLRPTFEQAVHYRLEPPATLPTLVDRSTDAVTPAYAVPNPVEPGVLKLGTHLGRVPVDPGELPASPDPERMVLDEAYAAARFPGAAPTGATDTCMYTMAPDEDFVIDRIGDVVVCSPCSGHGFKFAPLVGEIVADLVESKPPSIPLERFAVARPSLAV